VGPHLALSRRRPLPIPLLAVPALTPQGAALRLPRDHLGRRQPQLDELAIHTSAPSQALTAHRRNPASTVNTETSTRDKSLGILSIPDAGQVEQLLHDLPITEPAMLTRAQHADAAALDLITAATQAASRRHTIRDSSLGTWQHRISSH
jgi:hypothetical protein